MFAAFAIAPASVKAQDKDVESVVSLSPLPGIHRPTLSIGFDASTGRYGDTESTNTYISPLSLRLPVSTNFTVAASISHVQISGPNVVVGADGRPLPGVGLVRSTRSGMGDVSLGAAWEIPITSDKWSIQASSRIKIPTAKKSKGLSTGKTDYSGKVEVTFINTPFAPFMSVEYQVLGQPEGIQLRNTINTSIGTAWISGKKAIIASYDYNETISPLFDDSHSLFGAYSTPLSDKIRLTLYGIKGLSAGSPDLEAGALISFTL
jgi:hypothetical protein